MSSNPTQIEPFYVLDAHALLWYLLGDKKLSDRARMIFQAAEAHQTLLIVPAIVMAEVYFANGKFGWFDDFRALYIDIISKPYIRFMAFDHIHTLDFDRDSDVPEMHDRIIAGVARRIEAPLLTSDPLITAAKVARVEW